MGNAGAKGTAGSEVENSKNLKAIKTLKNICTKNISTVTKARLQGIKENWLNDCIDFHCAVRNSILDAAR